MKIIEKISLTIFSVFILVLSLILCLILFNWMDINNLNSIINYLKSTQTLTNVSLVVSIVLMLLAVKCIFFPSYSKEKEQRCEGLLLENETGKLLISIETIENLVKGVVTSFENVKSVNCKVKLDKAINNVVIDMNLVVTSETIIKELSADLQNKIKEIIKKTTEIDVKAINVRIKNIETQKTV